MLEEVRNRGGRAQGRKWVIAYSVVEVLSDSWFQELGRCIGLGSCSFLRCHLLCVKVTAATVDVKGHVFDIVMTNLVVSVA